MDEGAKKLATETDAEIPPNHQDLGVIVHQETLEIDSVNVFDREIAMTKGVTLRPLRNYLSGFTVLFSYQHLH